MGESFERELERVRRSRAEFEASQDEVERRKQDYFTAVRTLHEAGMPLREIASALGLSHQRVHQMVEEATGKKHAGLRRKAARAAKQGGVALLLVALGAGGFYQLGREPKPQVDRVSKATSRAPRERSVEPGDGHACALEIFDRHELAKAEGRRHVTFTVEPRCVIVEVRKRTG